MSRSVGWAATEHGYCVQVHDEHGQVESDGEYWAGNSKFDSQAYVDPSSDQAVPVETMRKFAEQTAKEMADERKIPHADVWEDVDLKSNLEEVHEQSK